MQGHTQCCPTAGLDSGDAPLEVQLWQDWPSSGQGASDPQSTHFYHTRRDRHGGPGAALPLLKGTFGAADLLLLMNSSMPGPSNLPLAEW